MKKWIVLLAVSCLFGANASADWESVDTWDMNNNGTWQSSDNSINLGGHYKTNNQQVAQISNDETFIFSPITASGNGGKTDLYSTADLTEGVVRLSWTFSSMDWSGTTTANNNVGFRLWNDAGDEYVELNFYDNVDKLFSRIRSSAGLGGLGAATASRAQVVGSLSNAVTRTVTLELDYANSEVRMLNSNNWSHNPNGANSDAVTNAVDFVAAGVTNISKFQTVYANWSTGDQIVFDNLAVERFVEPPVYNDVDLEKWTYTGVSNGTGLASVLSETGTGTKWNDTDLCVVSNELQRWEADGVLESAFQGLAAPSSFLGASNGLYQMSFDVVSADFSNTQLASSNQSAQVGYGLRSAANKNGMVLLRYNGKSGNNQIELSVSTSGSTNEKLLDGTSLSNLHVRAVYDLDVKTIAVNYSFDNGVTETTVTRDLDPAFNINTLRMQVQTINGNNNWQPGDVVEIDNLTFSRLDLVPETGTGIADSGFADLGDLAQTNKFTTLNAQAGDYVIVTVSGNKGNWDDGLITLSGSAVLGGQTYDKISKAPSVQTWYAPVLSNGTVDVTLTMTEANKGVGSAVAYVITASSGDVDVLTTSKTGIDNGTYLSVTNGYDFSAVTNGLVVEGMSSYANDGNGMSTDNADFVLGYSDDIRRQVGHISFEGLSAMTNIWTATTNRQSVVLGVVFVEGDGTEGPQDPTEFYEEWLLDSGYSEDTVMTEAILLEYASGSAASLPVSGVEGDYFIHIHTEWNASEATARGLAYDVAGDDNLAVDPAWSGVVELVGTAVDTPSAGLNTVTNQVSSADAQEFIRLSITFTP